MKRKKDIPAAYRVPRSTQKTIPIEAVHEDGMMRFGSTYSTCFHLEDMNYAATSMENQAQIVLGLEDIIKSCGSDANLKLIVWNRLLKEDEVLDQICCPPRGDDDDDLRAELNALNGERALKGNNRMRRDRYLVLSGPQESPDQARAWHARLRERLERDVHSLGTEVQRLDAEGRFSLLAEFFRPQTQAPTPQGRMGFRNLCRAWIDRIAPDMIEFAQEGSFFRIDERYGRALLIRDFPAHMDDGLLEDILALPREMLAACDYAVMDKDDALRIVQRHKDTVEADIRKRTVNAGREGNWNAAIPRHLEEERDTCAHIFDILTHEDQRLVMAQVVIVHMASSLRQLELDTASIRAQANTRGADIGILRCRQERGLNTALPYGVEQVGQRRLISSENASFLMPFRTREIFESGGIVYGINEISRNIVMMNRMAYKNGNGFIVGDAGGGKSVLAKSEMYAVYLTTEDDMIIVDPDGEYGRLVEWLGGQVVRICADSPDHINMMDISSDFDAGDDPIALKCGVVSGACDLMLRGSGMSGAQRSITDRCVRTVLTRALAHPEQPAPTLTDVYEELMRQDEPAAREVALAMELYTVGSLNTFAQRTNVNLGGRILCFNIQDLSPQMRDLGMMVVLDEIDRRVARNRRAGRHTWVWCDEIWTLLHYPQTQEFLWGFWKRCRKYGGLPTGITQSLNAVKDSEKGREMLSNSEFVFMMGCDLFPLQYSKERAPA